MAVKEGLSSFCGLMCEILNSVGQGKFKISENSGCGNHVKDTSFCLINVIQFERFFKLPVKICKTSWMDTALESHSFQGDWRKMSTC